MDSRRIAVPAELANASSTLHGKAAEFGETLRALRQRVAALSFTWTGGTHGSHAQYVQYTDEWDASANALFGTPGTDTGLLPEIGDIMAGVWNNYREVEIVNARGWNHT